MWGRKDETPADSAAIRAELGRVIAALSGSERLRKFLSFIVDETLQGRAGQIKEYVIGVQVYGKPAVYDARTDSTVRVEASRLRARLQQCYDTEGRNSRIVITIPKGGYVPAFGTSATSQRRALPAPAARWIGIASAIVLGLGLTLGAWTLGRQKSLGAIPLPMSLTTYKGQQKAPACLRTAAASPSVGMGRTKAASPSTSSRSTRRIRSGLPTTTRLMTTIPPGRPMGARSPFTATPAPRELSTSFLPKVAARRG
jgi:hypothetical protein